MELVTLGNIKAAAICNPRIICAEDEDGGMSWEGR
jgi:hypothetical protein